MKYNTGKIMPFISNYLCSIKFILLALILSISACSNTTPPPSNPPNLSQAKIYINQVAFDLQAPKQAVVSLPLGENATRFIVYKGSDIVHQAKLKPQPVFNEWGQGAQYYLADFSSIKRRGEFHIVVNTRKQQIKSSPFIIKQSAYFELTAKSLLNYFKANRHINPQDKSIRIEGTEQAVDVSGGWNNSGGDNGKQLSHLSQSNYLIPQQSGLAVWALAKSYNKVSKLYDRKGLSTQVIQEVMWGADYLHRILDNDGYFYSNITDNKGTSEERLIIGDGNELNSLNFQAAFREGGGMAIAALASAHELSLKTRIRGEFAPAQYLIDAEKAFAHLQKNNLSYLNNDKENIIDDYTALIAATALYRVTNKDYYLQTARHRAHNLNSRVTPQGWFISDDDKRPYYHNTEAGLPIIALIDYLSIEPKKQIRIKTKRIIKSTIDYQLTLNEQVTNPFNLARQPFTAYKNNQYNQQKTGFFMPHTNEANAWQGENSRLSSLTAAAIWAGKYTHANHQGSFGVNAKVANFAQSQLDWIMGKNPYQMCMLYGLGINNPPLAKSAGKMLNGGVSNGITGATQSADGTGITWAEGPDESNWRWTEQWLQNSAWYLLAITAMVE